ncbi:MAG: hypothetical protein JXA08_05040 [Methanomicrobiaceae archaeon]|nr:hypothetical protein [Methanomicrobiaceae archaeon]
MRVIIDRKIYDTRTAEQIAEYSSSHNRGDFAYFEETLYRTKKGNWFLHGEGGPASPYTELVGTSISGSSSIVPMCADEVIRWLERRNQYDVLEKLFPDAVTEA